MSDDSAFAVAEVCQGIRPACSGNSKGQAEFLSRQKQPVGLQEKSLLTPLKPRVFIHVSLISWTGAEGLGEMGNNPSVFKDLRLALVRVKVFWLLKAKLVTLAWH